MSRTKTLGFTLIVAAVASGLGCTIRHELIERRQGPQEPADGQTGNQLAETKLRRAELDAQVRDLEGLRDRLNQEIASLEKRVELVKAEGGEASRDVDRAQIRRTELLAKIDKTLAQLKGVDETLIGHREECARLAKDIGLAHGEVDQSKKVLRGLDAKEETLKSSISDLETEKRRLEVERTALDKANAAAAEQGKRTETAQRERLNQLGQQIAVGEERRRAILLEIERAERPQPLTRARPETASSQPANKATKAITAPQSSPLNYNQHVEAKTNGQSRSLAAGEADKARSWGTLLSVVGIVIVGVLTVIVLRRPRPVWIALQGKVGRQRFFLPPGRFLVLSDGELVSRAVAPKDRAFVQNCAGNPWIVPNGAAVRINDAPLKRGQKIRRGDLIETQDNRLVITDVDHEALQQAA